MIVSSFNLAFSISTRQFSSDSLSSSTRLSLELVKTKVDTGVLVLVLVVDEIVVVVDSLQLTLAYAGLLSMVVVIVSVGGQQHDSKSWVIQ